MTKQCPNCFFENDDSAKFCEVCGKSLQPSEFLPQSSGASIENLLSSFKKLRFAFIIALFSAVISFVLSAFVLMLESHIASHAPSGVSTSNPHVPLSTYFAYLVPIIVVSLILTIASYYFIIVSFKGLKKSSYDFSIGYKGGILILVSDVAVTLLSLFLLSFIFQLATAPNDVFTSSIFSLLGLSLGILAFAIPLLIGIIFLAIGIFRVGDRYQSDSLKAGAIINIFIPLVGAILIIYGTTKIIERLNSSGSN